MFIGRQVTAVCRRCPPATRSPTTTSDQPASSSLVYFPHCLPAFLCIFVSPLDPLRDHRLWWTTPLAEKCALARSKSDFSARLPEQSDAVWTCKKSSHSIFVLIYNDIYHFYGQTRWFQKGTRTSQLTQHIVYESRSHFQERRKTNFSSSVSVSPKRASVLKSRLLQCSKAVFFSTEHSSSAFELFLWTPT